MTKHYALSAAKRDEAGKGVARALRRENRLPAVIYGDNKAPVTISLPAKEVGIEYHKGHMFTTICDMNLDGEKIQVLARDVQVHPVRDTVMHVDFLRVSDKTRLKVNVPVHFTNYEDSPAGTAKGVLNIVRHEVEVFCLAKNIPDAINVDLAKAEIGDTIHISNADMPDGAKPVIDDRDFTLATIAAPKRIEVEEEASEGADVAPDEVEATAQGGSDDEAKGE